MDNLHNSVHHKDNIFVVIDKGNASIIPNFMMPLRLYLFNSQVDNPIR
ncbi:hypothetical protein HMPREF3034_02555 [Prevotella sp. DNF00663]|nr:hypothetical protein HMPREF3034_02555 [Prevotella sp. DNF00663]